MQLFLLVLFHYLSISYCSTLSGLNLYHTYQLLNHIYRDCLYYYVPERGLVSQLIQYCIRFHLDEQLSNFNNRHRSFRFEELHKNNVTSFDLYMWSAPIDLIEQYQIYLENGSSTTNTFLYYNCTYPWFGSRCEYTFDYPQSTFTRQVEMNFDAKSWLNESPPSQYLPCYVHIKCNRVIDHGKTVGGCLDWREICDGKVDCINGGYDEEQCWHLEINECDSETEFRCHNGLCIPLIFLNDDQENADCLDRTDERIPYGASNFMVGVAYSDIPCNMDPASRCEDHMYRPIENTEYQVECGDGTRLSPFKFNCLNMRALILIETFFTEMNVSNQCRSALYCIMWLQMHWSSPYQMINDCNNTKYTLYTTLVKEHCPSLVEFPPILFGHVRFVYIRDHFPNIKPNMLTYFFPPTYICYNVDLCGYDLLPVSLYPFIHLSHKNTTCQLFNTSKLSEQMILSWFQFVDIMHTLFYPCSNSHQLSSMPKLFQSYACANSTKVISQHRLLDKIQDCLYGDDESYTESCSLNTTSHRFKCKVNNNTICLSHLLIRNKKSDCDDKSDENEPDTLDYKTAISFQTMCDGVTELSPIFIDGRNETDETECSHFPCNNMYTRCDGFWNCKDGVDEINCEWPPICPPLHHMCLSLMSNNLTCLSIKHVNDNITDCFGASDEREYCQQSYNNALRYRCFNSNNCILGSHVCQQTRPMACPMNDELSQDLCHGSPSHAQFPMLDWQMKNLNHVGQLLCTLGYFNKLSSMHFSLIGNTSYSFVYMNDSTIPSTSTATTNQVNNDFSSWNMSMTWYCNRGIMIRRLKNNENDSEIVCLCPPAYYGRFCQYQNQRISLTIQMKVLSDWRTVFAIVITLRDDKQGLIESYDQLNYLPSRDCNKKFNIYLLYATQPKNPSTNYTVRVDVYNKHTLEYRASWAFPIRFPFLPVQRMSVQLQIPLMKTVTQECGKLQCGLHGHCLKYINTNILFCQCNTGWSGIHCNISHTCNCSPGSLCLDSSICICPLGKFGNRCYLKHLMCLCENNGICLLNDIRLTEKNDFWCICPEGFSGLRCERVDTKIIISFEPTVAIQSLVLVHFIEVFNKTIPHIHTTILKKISFDNDTITVVRSNPFHIVFVEIDTKTFYLIILEIEYKYSFNISSKVMNSNRCLSITELFNTSFIQMHLLRRMKYYHIPCQERKNLECFYDEKHMCICNHTLQQANCFTFNHSVENYDCKGENICENGGSCFHDKAKCPSLSTCICDDCSYGSRCQFSTKGFGLSLDTILGYQIRPNQSITGQRSSIKVTTAITTIMLVFSFISSTLSILTFHTVKAREVGCGYYLLIASFISVCVTIIFGLKFFFLMGSQMGLIINRNYILFNCILMDFLMKSLLSIIDWLYVCVSIERTIAAMNDANFNKAKSKRVAKWVIIGICLFTFLTYVHDPIHRRLIDDEQEHRTWCIVDYNRFFKAYNSVILLLHFILPFIINIISAFVIIIRIARRKSIMQQQVTYKHQLLKQLYTLKRLLISPVILIVLSLPHLIISFSSGCMKSPKNPWLYLVSYFTSFISPMAIFFIFVLPSHVYKKEFTDAIQRIRQYFSH